MPSPMFQAAVRAINHPVGTVRRRACAQHSRRLFSHFKHLSQARYSRSAAPSSPLWWEERSPLIPPYPMKTLLPHVRINSLLQPPSRWWTVAPLLLPLLLQPLSTLADRVDGVAVGPSLDLLGISDSGGKSPPPATAAGGAARPRTSRTGGTRTTWSGRRRSTAPAGLSRPGTVWCGASAVWCGASTAWCGTSTVWYGASAPGYCVRQGQLRGGRWFMGKSSFSLRLAPRRAPLAGVLEQGSFARCSDGVPLHMLGGAVVCRTVLSKES